MVELLIVVGIMVLLIGILIPTLGTLRENARTVICTSGMRQWGLAQSSYVIDWQQKLPWEGTFGTTTRYINGVSTSVQGNTQGDAWYNALPPYVNAPQYGMIYDGTASLTALAQADNGYKNAWIWYCPTRVLDKKNSSTNKNSAQYAMNAILNGSSTFGKDWGTHANGDLQFNSINTIPQPSRTPFMLESDQNTASESFTTGPARTRHRGAYCNFLFLDQHVELILGASLPPTSTPGGSSGNSPDGTWTFSSPDMVWGPWRR
jgi:prepilin-type processing-associated H-X9-DG protein